MVDEIKIRMDPRLAGRLAEKKVRLDQHRPLPPHTLRRLHEDMRVLLTYHSNAIEGNTLSLSETRLVIEEGLTIGGHTMREHLEAQNHAEAFDYLAAIVDRQREIDRDTVLTMHRLVMARIDPQAGQLREVQVRISGASFVPPPGAEVPALLDDWLAWVQRPAIHYGSVEQAAIAHSLFENIHPFTDGNGRVGRLILNLMLMRDGYPPALLLCEWRRSYIRALDTAYTRRNYSPLINLLGRAVEGGLDRYLEAVTKTQADAYQPLAELAQGSGYSVDYLGWLVRKGRLEATKRGGRWYSTPAALTRYIEQAGVELARRRQPRRQHDDARSLFACELASNKCNMIDRESVKRLAQRRAKADIISMKRTTDVAPTITVRLRPPAWPSTG